jgi:hypothetical protein
MTDGSKEHSLTIAGLDLGDNNRSMARRAEISSYDHHRTLATSTLTNSAFS